MTWKHIVCSQAGQTLLATLAIALTICSLYVAFNLGSLDKGTQEADEDYLKEEVSFVRSSVRYC